MSHAIPPAPGPEWTFAPPPGWTVPPGFDPRTGLQPDPLWPDAPVDWVFWVKSIVPAAARGSFVQRVGGPRVLVGIAFVAVIAIVAISSFLGSAHSPSSGVGSCWKPSTGSQFAEADCNDGAASDKVVAEVSNPDLCPSTSTSYLDTVTDGPTRYQCLVPNPH